MSSTHTLVICAGMPRSASTWQYQVAAEMVERFQGGRRLGFGPWANLKAEAEAEDARHVVKVHDADNDYRQLLESNQAVALYSYRDMRDVAFSLAHKHNQPFDKSTTAGTIHNLKHTFRFWQSCPNVLVQRYEHIIANAVDAVLEIANHIGVEITLEQATGLAGEFSFEKNLERTERIREEFVASGVELDKPENAMMRDEKSQLHWNHIRADRPDWESLATQGQREFLARECGDWLIETGYEADRSWAYPSISVVVPVKNGAKYVSRSVESILSQGYPRLQCIVVDGGSSDGTIAALQPYRNQIQVINGGRDRGPFDAINLGWKQCTGDVLCWLNADDSWAPGALKTIAEFFIDHPETDIAHGQVQLVDDEGTTVAVGGQADYDWEYALRYCQHVLAQPSVFLRRWVVEKAGYLYPSWAHDQELWLRAAAAGATFGNTRALIATAHWTPDRASQRPELMIPARVRMTRRYFRSVRLPANLRALKREAISNSYLRGLDLLPRGTKRRGLWWAYCVGGALWAAPDRAGRILYRVLSGEPGYLERKDAQERIAAMRTVLEERDQELLVKEEMIRTLKAACDERLAVIDQLDAALRARDTQSDVPVLN